MLISIYINALNYSMFRSSLLIAAATVTSYAGSERTPVAVLPDKSQYHLFNPAPRELMREMSTDRPDTTESPYSVDAGHFQVEMSVFDYSRDRADGLRVDTWTLGAVNLKAGLTERVDFQVVVDAYTEERTRVGEVDHTLSGFSDVILRLKTNLWGNEGNRTALAIMPYLKIPTDSHLSNGRCEGGVILPFATSLTERVGLGLMLEADFVHDETNGGYDVEWLHSAVVGFDLTKDLGCFVEYVGVASPEAGFDYQASFHVGFTFAVSNNLVLDTGIRIGLNEAAEDVGVFAGLSIRF